MPFGGKELPGAGKEPGGSAESKVTSDLPKFDFDAWAEAGFPPVVQPVEDVSKLTASDAHVAEAFFEASFNVKWRKRGKLHLKAVIEVIRLNGMFPEAFERVLERYDLPVEEWRENTQWMESRMTVEKLERRRKGEGE